MNYMPNIKSAVKRMKIGEKKRQANIAVKSRVRTAVKRFQDTLTQGDPEIARNQLRTATQIIDKASSKGVYHKNTAARRKSQLARMFNQLKSRD